MGGMLSRTGHPYKYTLGSFAGNFDSFPGADFDTDVLISHSDPPFRPLHRKRRKTRFQIECLLSAFDSRRVWTKEEIDQLSAKTGLSTGQVYKWNWDFRKKRKKQVVLEANQMRDLLCPEVIRQSALDEQLYQQVADYRTALRRF